MREIVLAGAGFLIWLFTSACVAQPIFIGASVQVGPLTIYCVDALGNRVLNYFDSTNQIAVATVLNGGPAIVLDQNILGNAPWAFDVFTYAHECAHHYLGHVVNPSFAPNPQQELAADCMAAKSTRNYKWLNPQQFSIAMQVVYTFAASPSHPPGPYRVANANACYVNPP